MITRIQGRPHQYPLLATHQLSIGYQKPGRNAQAIASDIDVHIQTGQLICLLGPNGAGKSTLIRTLVGSQAPLEGKVLLDGQDIHAMAPLQRARRLAVVLTERIPGNNLRAGELVALGRVPFTRWDGVLNSHDRAMVRWAIDAVQGQHLALKLFSELSDGERQKMLIARALAQDPELIVLDEPTAFLDLPRRAEIMRLLRQLAHQAGRAILLSTHDLDLALRSADQLWLLPAHGPLLAGVPEALVLAGHFEAAFAAEGITFDPSTGAFRIVDGERGTISLVGEGLTAMWTQRALERLGYQVLPDLIRTIGNVGTNQAVPPMHVEIEQTGSGAAIWHLRSDSSHQQFNRLEAFLDALAIPDPN